MPEITPVAPTDDVAETGARLEGWRIETDPFVVTFRDSDGTRRVAGPSDMPLPRPSPPPEPPIVMPVVGGDEGDLRTMTAEEAIAENDRLTVGPDPMDGIQEVRARLGRDTWSFDDAMQEINNLGRLENGWTNTLWAPVCHTSNWRAPVCHTSNWTDGTSLTSDATSANDTSFLFTYASSNAVHSCDHHPNAPAIHFHEDPYGPDSYSRRRRDNRHYEHVRGWWTYRGQPTPSLGHAIALHDGIFNLQGSDGRVTPLNWQRRISREERAMVEQLNDQAFAAWVASAVRSDRDRQLLEMARREHVSIEEARRRKDAEHLAAETNARALLESMLSEADRRMLAAHGYIEVRGGKTGHRYRVIAGHHGTRNVLELDRHGNPRRRLCAHPYGVPDGDVLLAQKLVIETNEDLFLATANVSDP